MTTNQEAEPRVAEAPTVEDLRRRACTPIAQSIAAALGPGQPRERFDASMALMEGITARVCQLLNSLYLHSARDLGVASLPPLDQRLLELGRKNLSFGDYSSAMELFLNKLSPAVLHASVAPCWNEIAAPLRDHVAVGEDIAALEMVKLSRDRYSIPVPQLEAYLDDHRTTVKAKASLAKVLVLATTYRNARAHHHGWFSDEEQWYVVLMDRWNRVLERVMLHPPIYRILTAVEIVTTQAVGRMTTPGHFLWDAARGELDELRRPLGESKLSSPAHLGAGSYWARRPGDELAPLQWLFPSREFPENVESAEQREQRYRSRILAVYLDAGTLRATDIDSTLRALGAELGIDEKSARQFESETVLAIRAAEAEMRAGEDKGALGPLGSLVQRFETQIANLRVALAALDERRTQSIYALIEDQWPISHASLKNHSEMNLEDLDRSLQKLLASTDPLVAVRRVEPAPGKVHYRIPSRRATEELTAALDRVRAEPEWITPLRPLLEVCQQFFMEEGHPELPAAIGKLLLEERHRGGATSTNLESVDAPRLLFAVRGKLIAVSSVPDLLREIVSQFGHEPALLAKVPFASGRRRNLVARDARHAAGHDFIAPLEFKESGLIFEANQSRFSALKSLRQWFAAAGIPVDRAEVDGHSIDELGAQTTNGIEAPVLSSNHLTLHLRFDGRSASVSAPTAGTFLGEIVHLLVGIGRLTDEDLPVPVGRIRYLVAPTPWHANGRAFDSPVEAEGMFIESAMTRRDARAHAAALCRKVHVEVLDKDIEVDLEE